MSKMLRLELVGLVLLACTQILTEHRDFYGPRNQYGHRPVGSHHGARTREVQVKYGRLKGTIVQPNDDNLQLVDVFLGVPYAEPPLGQHRFEPPKTQTPWTGVRHFVNFAPVCPQILPNLDEVIYAPRHHYLEQLMRYLHNQSEDCLYLNIYAPHQNNSQRDLVRYPVMVFIHGESYEWNSGNPYEGSVLAAYGNVVFVTVNFRLGILGFLRPGTKDDTASNFGLLDQIAALAWLKDNIGQFGGDPDSITLVGHGTGAVFVNLLMLSPINGLFKRAILMSGSALNPDAIGKAPLQITKQVAHALNCPQVSDEELAACLKNRSVQDLLAVKIHKPKYVPAFAPLVDSAVIPDKPGNLMKNAGRLARFDLMYGVTELEKFQQLPGVALLEGLPDSDRDEFIRDSLKASHELEPDEILRRVFKHYRVRRFAGDNHRNRDLALEVVSDSTVVAPLIATAKLHSSVNPKSYMYVFSHMRSFQDEFGDDFGIRQTVHGEELQYVLGAPLYADGHLMSGAYSVGEKLLSKAMMDWWCNFVYSGNPSSARLPPGRLPYLRDDYKTGSPYHKLEWPEFEPEMQAYFNLTTPPQIGRRYRAAEMEFWNEAIPDLLRRPKPELQQQGGRMTTERPNSNGSSSVPANVVVVVNGRDNATKESEPEAPSNFGEDGKVNTAEKESNEDGGSGSGGALRNSSAVSLVIGFGVVFLLINATALVYLYHKRQRMRKKATNLLAPQVSRRSGNNSAGAGAANSNNLMQEVATTLVKKSKSGKGEQQPRELGYCNSASKPDIRELIKNDKAYDNNSNFGRRSRENSSSTIDTRIKVREWIQQEIVHRCSPRFLRKTRETLQREHREKLMKQQQLQQQAALEDAHEQQQQQQQDEEEMMRRCLYEESRQIRVRPGVRRPAAATKVSVAVDATPAARTNSVLNQTPIELARTGASSEYLNSYEDAATILGASEYCEPTELQPEEIHEEEARGGANVVVIEHPHSRSDSLPMDKLPSYGASKAISTAARINESDSGSASSLYAKINPRLKSRLPVHQHKHPQQQQQEVADLSLRSQQPTMAAGTSTTLPRLLTFGSPAPQPIVEVNVTSREAANPPSEAATTSCSHAEALRTIRRRNYPKVLPDIEKRRSLPPNASFVIGAQRQPQGHRQPQTPPSPPPRLYGTSRSLDCVEDRDENEGEEEGTALMPVTTILHVGPLRKKTDSPKNQSVPSLTDAAGSDNPQYLSSATSLPVCPVHGTSREALGPGARSEPRIVIAPRIENNHETQQPKKEEPAMSSMDQPDCPLRVIPERATKLPRIIIKPTTTFTGTLPRTQNKATVAGSGPSNLQDNETYQRLLARREKMPLPGETSVSRIPSFTRSRMERTEVVQRVNVPEAAVTKL